MKYVVDAACMRAIDEVTGRDYGIEPVVLMENAARAIAEEIEKDKPQKAIIFCGGGNNGGDGYAAARWLAALHIPVTVVELEERLSPLAEQNRVGAVAFGVEMIPFFRTQEVSECLAGADYLVDALLGTGLTREIQGDYRTCVELINRCRGTAKVLAVDIPSGIHADTGQILGVAVQAHKTVTFAYAKYGHLLYPGREHTGELRVAEICTHKDAPLIDCVLEEADIREAFGPRKLNTHKGDYGKIAILGGTCSMEGAVQLAGMAALRAGAGLVTLGVPESNYGMYAARMPELMARPLPGFDDGSLEEIDALCRDKDCLVIGNGGGNSAYLGNILAHILHTYDMPVVIDADGLNVLSRDLSVLPRLNRAVLTPHCGEMARLMNCTVEEVLRAPLDCARQLAARTGAIVVLKGSTTVISAPDGRNTFNIIGSPGMATAGSGDVLSGIIAACAAVRRNLYQAVCTGVGLHGLAGRMAAEAVGQHAMTASDIIAGLSGIGK